WTQKANLPGTKRMGAIGFSIGNKGYIATGNNNSWWSDFWEWDQGTDTWIQKADFRVTQILKGRSI
ncbi:MAG: galactose oxidase, partial [bacterium]